MTSPVVEIRDLVIRYGEVGALDHVDLEIESGLLTALVGPSGCGKTTLLRAIAGFEVPASGTVRLGGELVAGPGCWVPPEERHVGMVFQDGALFPHLNVWENLCYGVRRLADGEERARAALELVHLSHLRERMPDELSGGQQQRVALARALAPAPRLVLLDEPFAGLDASLKQKVREEVRGILREAGISAILVTHDQEEALSVAQRVAVMHGGRVLQTGSAEEVYHRPASLEVARFIGDGHLVSCRVSGGRFTSAFGSAPCDSQDGPGLLFVRPEDFEILPGGQNGGVAGRVLERRFFGHDVLDRVLLEGGETVEVRSLSSEVPPIGGSVRLALRPRRFRVFGAPPAAAGGPLSKGSKRDL